MFFCSSLVFWALQFDLSGSHVGSRLQEYGCNHRHITRLGGIATLVRVEFLNFVLRRFGQGWTAYSPICTTAHNMVVVTTWFTIPRAAVHTALTNHRQPPFYVMGSSMEPTQKLPCFPQRVRLELDDVFGDVNAARGGHYII